MTLGDNLIYRSVAKVLSLVPFFRKNLEKGKEDYRKVMNNKGEGLNIGFAFGIMFLTTSVIYVSIGLWIGKLLNKEVDNSAYFYFITMLVAAYLTNEMLLYRSNVYKRYFRKFERVQNPTIIYLSAILFHVGVFCLGVLSASYTIGFNI